MNKKLIEKYTIKVNTLPVNVVIQRVDSKPIYDIQLPVFGEGSEVLMESIKDDAVKRLGGEGIDTAKEEVKEKFRDTVTNIVNNEVTHVNDSEKKAMINTICCNATGLGPIEWMLNDPNLEEIVVNGSKENIRVYHRKYGWLETSSSFGNDATIENYSKKIGRDVGREISVLYPLLDAHLPSGDRANAILRPIADKGISITIRKFATEPWIFSDFVENKTINFEVLALLWMAIQYEMNILISGGTASGKTSMLNICMPFIPPNHRIVSIEDTRELQLPSFLYWTPLSTRQPNPEGKGEVSMEDLLVNSLRMRPDRIVVGEVRKKRQAEVMFEAMHTGHSVYSTIHADTSNQTFRRLLNEPIAVPQGMIDAVHLNVVMIRDRRRGLRRVYEVGEIVASELNVGEAYDVNIMYRWSPRTDTIVKNQDSVRVFEEVSRHTALTDREINADIAEKIKILEWAYNNKVDNLEKVGNLMNNYYLDYDDLIKKVDANKKI